MRLFFILALTALNLHAHNSESTDRMLVKFKLSPQLKEVIRGGQFDIAGVNVAKGWIEILASDSDMQRLKRFEHDKKFAMPQSLLRGPDQEYFTPSEIEEKLREVVKQYPEIAMMKEIGKSLEGRSIWALKISDNVTQHEADEAPILFNSMHHAREVMSTEVSIDIIDYLTSRYGNDEQVRQWVDHSEVWIIPMFNVDGNNIVWTKDNMWRKNARGGFGVDINRNYPGTWNTCNGSSGSRNSQTYRGEKAGSEPETQVMMDFVSQVRPVFSISYHSYSEIVIYPYGCSPKHVAMKDVVETLGHEIGKSIGYDAGTSYELLYDVDGGDIDWMYDFAQVIPYVIEVNSDGEGFQPSYHDWRDKTVERNRPAWQLLLKRLHGAGVRGRVEIESVGLTIDVMDSKNKLIQNYKVNTDGSYHLVLNAGEYELRFKKETQVIDVKKVTVADKRIDFNM